MIIGLWGVPFPIATVADPTSRGRCSIRTRQFFWCVLIRVVFAFLRGTGVGMLLGIVGWFWLIGGVPVAVVMLVFGQNFGESYSEKRF